MWKAGFSEVRVLELDVIGLVSATDPWGDERVGFSAATTIDRRDFGLTWNQALEASACGSARTSGSR